MAVLNAVIVPAKALTNGRHKIRISVAHNGETRYIVTSIIIDSENEFKNGRIVKRPDASILNTKIRGILQQYQTTLDEIGYINGLTCSEVVFQLKNAENYKHRTLLSIYNEYMETARIKPKTINCYKSIWSTISKHLDSKLLVEHITYGTILGLEKYLHEERKLKPSSVRINLLFLYVLINYAKKCGYVYYRKDPFNGYELPPRGIRESWLSVEEIKKVRDIEITKPNLQKCRDLFMLSYYLGGINAADLVRINFKEQSDTIHYIRKKTEDCPKVNKFVEFKIPDEAKVIIDRHMGKDGFLNLSDFQKTSHLGHFFNYNMRKLATITEIRQLVFYSARKSFSQHAFKLDISTSVIDYILGHRVDKGGASLYSYISVTPDMATKAVRKVLDNLK